MTTEILQHQIEWHYFESFNPEELPDSEFEHIKEQIIEGYSSGELCYSDTNQNMQYGWWEIKKREDDPIYQQAIDDIQHLKENNLEG